jgi:uracil-DNA glycosylase family 4
MPTEYDPREYGARCDDCCLAGRTVVPPETRTGRVLLVGHEPDMDAEQEGKPFVGRGGKLLMKMLGKVGLKRHEVGLTNARICRLKKSEPKSWDKKSLACCRPRLDAEVTMASNVIALGKEAMAAVYGSAEGGGDDAISKLRGFPLQTARHEKKLLITYHPKMLIAEPKWIEIVEGDLAKAQRYFRNRLDWQDPTLFLDPTVDQIDATLARFAANGDLVAVDIETGDGEDALYPDRAKIRDVGLGSRDFGVCCRFNSVPRQKPYTYKTHPNVARERIRNFFASHKALCGHNVNVYDRPILARHGMPLPDGVLDSIIASHVADSEFPQNLGFQSSRYCDAPMHKPTHDHDAWESDHELDYYNLMDCCVSARVIVPIFEKMYAQLPPDFDGPHPVYASDAILQKLCVDMHASGMMIDLLERERHSRRLTVATVEAAKRADAIVGKHIALGSSDQVRDFLFGTLGLPWARETDSGEPSTDKDAIYELLMQSLPQRAISFIDALLDYRRSAKLKEAFVDTAIPWPVDGRVHPFWNCANVVSGRLSAKNPAVQTIPDKKNDVDSMRSMFIAAPGNVLVAADKEQLELRLVTEIAGDPLWKAAFLEGKDVHKLNAQSFLGTPYDKVEKFERDFAKTLVYMYLYGGGGKVAAGNMRKVRNPITGKRAFASFTEEQGEVMRARVLADHPALPAWWERVSKTWWASSPDPLTRAIRTRILGRVRHFKNSSIARPGWEDLKEMANHEIQGTGGDLMGGSGSSGKLMARIPRGLYGPGIIHHGHDSLMVEVKLAHVGRAVQALRESMTDSLGDMPLPCEVKIGRRWSSMVKVPATCDLSPASLAALLATEEPSKSQIALGGVA